MIDPPRIIGCCALCRTAEKEVVQARICSSRGCRRRIVFLYLCRHRIDPVRGNAIPWKWSAYVLPGIARVRTSSRGIEDRDQLAVARECPGEVAGPLQRSGDAG